MLVHLSTENNLSSTELIQISDKNNTENSPCKAAAGYEEPYKIITYLFTSKQVQACNRLWSMCCCWCTS